MTETTAPAPAEKTSRPRLKRRKKVAEILERVLDSSVADETELVYFERLHGVASTEPKQACFDSPLVTVLIRVAQGGRLGWHRTDVTDPSLLEGALRQAMALATVQPRNRGRRFLPEGETLNHGDAPTADSAPTEMPIRDRALEKLDADAAYQLVESWCAEDERARLHFSRTHLAVWNSHGLRRHATSTEATFDAAIGSGPNTGFASASARSLELLKPQDVLARARARTASGPLAELPTAPVSAVLSPEAVIELLEIVNIFAFAGSAYLDGSSFLSQHRGVQVFDRSVHVRDDAQRTPGMPFPFDLEGVLKKPVDLIVEGRASTPALTRAQGGAAGLEPTGQSIGGDDAMFGNLFVLPGHQDLPELLKNAEGGLFISRLEGTECFDPKRLGIRTLARGVRRIEGGKLGATLPDLLWQTSLLAALARLAGIGRHPVVRAMPSTPLGGISAPALALADASGFTVPG